MHIPFRTADARTILSGTPRTVRALLAGLPARWLDADEGPDTFSPWGNLAHLAYGERVDWIPRLRILLAHGQEQPFEPFDRRAHRDVYAGVSTADLLDEFERLRTENLEKLRKLLDDGLDLDRTGCHPELGVVTARQLLAAWVVHDLGHVRQIARVLAKQYGDEVGPWTAYLPVLE